MTIGRVKWFNAERGYGFIETNDGKDLFVHYTSIEGNGFRNLDPGQLVKYEVVTVGNRREAIHVIKL